MIAAHIAGMPVEELLPSIVGPGVGLAAVRVWIALRWRDREDGKR
ncbi:MAG: hypothetical protein ACM3NV_01980 [Syntrophothermus sp.]